jgi:hypothetical protein
LTRTQQLVAECDVQRAALMEGLEALCAKPPPPETGSWLEAAAAGSRFAAALWRLFRPS